jgi:flagellar biosynthesis/type III secretory pathway protein FliH
MLNLSDIAPLVNPASQAEAPEALFRQVTLGRPVSLKGIHPHQQVLYQQKLADEAEAQARKQEAQTTAEAIIANAHAEARTLLAKAHERAQAIEAETEAGFEAGMTAGFEAAADETLELLSSAKLVTEAAYSLQHKLLQQAQPQAVVLMQHILTTLCQWQWQQAPAQWWASLWQQAIDALQLSGQVTVVVHPTHWQLLQGFHEKTQQGLAGLSRFVITTDAQLPTEACFLLSEEGLRFDVSHQQQLALLLEPLRSQFPLALVVDDEAVVGDDEPSAKTATPQKAKPKKQVAKPSGNPKPPAKRKTAK